MARKSPKRIFISSTTEDLGPYRDAAEKAIVQSGHAVERNEYWTASSERPPYAACMKKVDDADAVAVIVAHRYGWVPDDQPGDHGRSITRLEVLRALEADKEVFAFVIDEDHPWPPKQIEKDVEALRGLDAFKASLNSGVIRNTFTSEGDLREKLKHAISEWEKRPRRKTTKKKTARKSGPDLRPFLTAVKNEFGSIEIRGLQVGSGHAHSFPIDELYVPLKMAHALDEPHKGRKRAAPTPSQANPGLEEALKQKQVVIVGDPGAGKTTFLKRIAFELAQSRLGDDPKAAEKRLGRDTPLPLYIRMGELSEHRTSSRERKQGPTVNESPAWVPHFLAERSKENDWGLNESFFRKALETGEALLLLDGLDEAPSLKERAALARIFEKAVAQYAKCRFVVTTRPRAYEGRAVLSGFATAHVEPFGPEAVNKFLEQWSKGLFPGNAQGARKHHKELAEALKAKPEIAGMAKNPVMLTAMAALYWNDKKLPDDRAELYESILKWLLLSRKLQSGRVGEKVARRRLSRIALAMQLHPKGRQTQVRRRWAAEVIADELGGDVDAAEEFVAEEEIDSGVITSSGRDIRFWHLTFQEYLSARAIGGQSDLAAQMETLGTDDRIHQPEWRETALLFAGVLFEQGEDKLDAFVSKLLDGLGAKASLAEKARCVGLLGAMVRDLRSHGYEPSDKRYYQTVQAVKVVFDPVEGQKIDIRTRIEAADALGQAGDERFAEDDALWVTIPGGKFWMGAQSEDPKGRNYDPEADDDEELREVEVRTFEIRRFPVTVGEYEDFVEDGGYEDERWWTAGGFEGRSEPGDWEEQQPYKTRPVHSVSWFEAAAFCAWKGWRLPSMAEWEFAARGAEARRYAWGFEPPDGTRANFSTEGSPNQVTPVGLYPAGQTPDHGVDELSGSVDEWCSDREGEDREIRGGSWLSSARLLRCSLRGRGVPDLGDVSVGFRCVREVSP